MDTQSLPSGWPAGSSFISGSTAAPFTAPAGSQLGSSGSDSSTVPSPVHATSITSGNSATQRPIAAHPARNGANAVASGSGSGKLAAGGEKGKGVKPIAPGQSTGQGAAKVRKKRDPGDGKRRKVAKACLVCQKSHLTCDEKRPCTRCVKKGIADQCVEGVRKKAKYLMEGELKDFTEHPAQTTTSISPATSSSHRPSEQPSFSLSLTTPPVLPPIARTNSDLLQPLGIPGLPTLGREEDIWLAPQMLGPERLESPERNRLPSELLGDIRSGNGTGVMSGGGDGIWDDPGIFGNGGFDFGTSASNEYQMLDAMLNSMSPVFPFDLPDDNQLSLDPMLSQPAPSPYLTDHLGSSRTSGLSMLGGQPTSSYSQPRHPDFLLDPPSNPHQSLISPNWASAPPQSHLPDQQPDMNRLSAGMAPSPWTNWTENASAASRGSFGAQSMGGSEARSSNAGPSAQEQGDMGQYAEGIPGISSKQGRLRTSAEVYHSVVKPFDYTEGYHLLMEHISKNFQQKEVLRVVKALAAFRPSLIALQMPMSEEDEVFLERSFQRTLIELEKLISYSATPTAVWRRTGEIVYANPEFCGLIGKQQDELLSGKTYIYQLFAKQSAISYWENFSVHAFENTTQNFFQATTLEVGDVSLACSCCYTIRRDVFDLPSVIIGQFLPIPTDI